MTTFLVKLRGTKHTVWRKGLLTSLPTKLQHSAEEIYQVLDNNTAVCLKHRYEPVKNVLTDQEVMLWQLSSFPLDMSLYTINFS